MKSWIFFVLLSVIFFVFGQVCLKYDKNDSIKSCCYFTISMGIVGAIVLMFINKMKKNKNNKVAIYSIIAGVLFFFGNLFWIYSIKSSPSLALVRVFMAGGETILLLFAGYLFFKQYINVKSLIGILLILSGVHLISKN